MNAIIRILLAPTMLLVWLSVPVVAQVNQPGLESVAQRGTPKARPRFFNPFSPVLPSRLGINPFGMPQAFDFSLGFGNPFAADQGAEEETLATSPIASSSAQPISLGTSSTERPSILSSGRPSFRPPVRSPYRPPPRPGF